jgi:RNA recognition motif-containing protein
MARRLYLGRLPTDARQEEVQKLFDGYGTITDCRVMSGKGTFSVARSIPGRSVRRIRVCRVRKL